MVDVVVNNFIIKGTAGMSILNVLRSSGYYVSRFCHNDHLPIAGSCRACLIEITGVEKPVASCVTETEPNLVLWTSTAFSQKARENVLEFLLRNHPLDCPICDQGGECDLQDQTKTFGGIFSRFSFQKRGVVDKKAGFFIKTIMTRCIHCTRCVRFNILNNNSSLGILNRGTQSEIGNYILESSDYELSANIIDLCPVGALTARTYAFKNRPWELKICEALDLLDGLCSNIYVNYKESKIYKIAPKPNKFLNGNLITNRCRFSYDALNENRLKKIYEYNSSQSSVNQHFSYSSLTWFSFLNKINFTKKGFCDVIITEDIDLVNFIALKKISNKYCNKVRISLGNKFTSGSNFYLYNTIGTLNDFEKNNKTYILLSAHTRIENAILHFKLKLKHKKNLISLFSLGRFFKSDLNIDFLSLNLKNILLLSEAKLIKASFIFINSVSAVILVGESLYKRFFNSNPFLFYLKKKIPGVSILNIHLFCNEEGLLFLHAKNKTNKRVSPVYFCVNLNDNLFFRKYIHFAKKTLVWVNTHRPLFDLKADYLLPVSTHFEVDGIYMNLEGLVQKNHKIFTSLYESKSLLSIFSSLFNIDSTFITKSLTFYFLFEIIKMKQTFYNNFDKTEKLGIIHKTLVYKASMYPIKGNLEQYYHSHKFTSNSAYLRTEYINATQFFFSNSSKCMSI